MKPSFTVLFACIAAGFAAPITEGGNEINEKNIGDLIFNAFAFYKKAMLPYDPQAFDDLVDFRIYYPKNGIDIRVNMTGISLKGMAVGNSIDELEVDPLTFVTKVSIKSPVLLCQADYELRGTLFNKVASGKGALRLYVKNYRRVLSNLSFEEVEGSWQIKTLNFTQTHDEIELQLENIQVEGMTSPEVESKLIATGENYIRQDWEKPLTDSFKTNINEGMDGYSIQQVIAWLKGFKKM